MSIKIAVASGKGGTGKTSVSLNLFHHLKKEQGISCQLIDCDVEEPNDHLFLHGGKINSQCEARQLLPIIDSEKCTYCRACVDWCEFNAIVLIPTVKYTEISPTLCHACGACLEVCKDDALKEHYQEIGKISQYILPDSSIMLEGRLKIGSPMQTGLIRQLKEKMDESIDINILDAPPGTSCPVVETIADTNFTVLVAEPGPFGLHDLTLMVDLIRETEQAFGVIINKVENSNTDIHKYLKEEGITLIGEIPFNREYAVQYSKANIFDNPPQEIEASYNTIINNLLTNIGYERNNDR